MSQVKNLRAMFENKGDDSSPPDRGRSPGPSGSITPSASFTGSPRPLSRIRSSFVAIEKDGRLGLQRTTSEDGSVPRRRMSGDTDAESISAMSDNRSTTTAGEESTRPVRRMFINDPIPESPRLPQDAESSFRDLGAVTDQPSTNPDKNTDEEQPSKHLLSGDPTAATGASAKTSLGVGAINGKVKSSQTAASSAGPTKSTASAATTKTTSRPSAISTKSSAKATVPSKSPATVKTPTSAASSTGPKSTARTTTRTSTKREAAPTVAKPTASTATKSAASSTLKKPAPLKPSTSGTGFVKPKVKSPTKPVNLPPSLMAQTASSGAKGNASRPSLAPQTGNAQARASSRASGVAGTGKFPKAPVSKHPRPSVGPPPKRNNQEKPVSRESNVDEGFLARMMRPTASSAQKTTEKIQLTPPRRTAGRPSTTSSRRESSVRSSSRAKTPSIHASEVAFEHKNNTSINEIAAESAIAETAEEAAEASHDVDLAPSEEKLPEPSVVEEAVPVSDEQVTRQVEASQLENEIETESAAKEPVVAETAAAATTENVIEPADEASQLQSPVNTEPETEHAVDEPYTANGDTGEEAAIQAANVETAEEIAEVAEEADLVQNPVEPELLESHKSQEDDVAIDTAQVETAEEVIDIAEDTDLAPATEDCGAIITATNEQKIDQPVPRSEMAVDASDEPDAAETKQKESPLPNDSDIDSLVEKLAETRIEAGDEKTTGEEANGTR